MFGPDVSSWNDSGWAPSLYSSSSRRWSQSPLSRPRRNRRRHAYSLRRTADCRHHCGSRSLCSFPPKKLNSAYRVSGLGFEHKNRGLFVVMSGCGHVAAVQFRRPEGSTGAGPRRDFPDGFVVICIFLLIRENIPVSYTHLTLPTICSV